MRNREFLVPQDQMLEFAEALGENGLTNTINGITEDDEIIVRVAYTKDDIELIQELEELIYQDDDEDDDKEDD